MFLDFLSLLRFFLELFADKRLGLDICLGKCLEAVVVLVNFHVFRLGLDCERVFEFLSKDLLVSLLLLLN